MTRNFEFNLALNLTRAADEFAYEHLHGALYYVREARTFAGPEAAEWFAAAEAFIFAAMAADDAAAEAAEAAAPEVWSDRPF